MTKQTFTSPTPQCTACCKQTQILHICTLSFKNKLQLPVYHCTSCEHRWLATSAEEQRKIEEDYSSEYTGFRQDPYFVNRIKDELVNRLKHFAPKQAELLDVGCGNGSFLAIAQELGFKCEGIDISESSARICTDAGLIARSADYTSYNFEKKFGIITMWDVMEHLKTPLDFLERSRELLLDSGILVLKIPSFGPLNFSFLKIFKTKSGVLLGAPDHTQYFSEKSLIAALQTANYKTVFVLPDLKFRSKPPTKSIKRKLSRFLQKIAYKLASNKNLYVIALKEDRGTTEIDQKHYIRTYSLQESPT